MNNIGLPLPASIRSQVDFTASNLLLSSTCGSSMRGMCVSRPWRVLFFDPGCARGRPSNLLYGSRQRPKTGGESNNGVYVTLYGAISEPAAEHRPSRCGGAPVQYKVWSAGVWVVHPAPPMTR